TKIKLSLYLLPQIMKDPFLRNIYHVAASSTKNQFSENKNDKISCSYTLLRDINNHPIGMIRLTMPRDIVNTGEKSIFYYLIVYIISGFLLATVIWYLLRVLILNRLERL